MKQRGLICGNYWWGLLILLLGSCRAVQPLQANKKYSADALQQEFDLFRNILEDSHPGLYWYQPKAYIDQRFDHARSLIKDSLNETGFRNILSYSLSGIGCGHTTVKPSKAWLLANRSSSRFFPLVLKLWPDTAYVVANLNRKDTLLKTGAIVHAIDGKPMQQIIDTLFQHLSTDGYNTTHKYQVLSNRGGFGNLYTSLFGNRPRYQVAFTDSMGNRRTAMVLAYQAARDTTAKPKDQPRQAQPRKRERRRGNIESIRSLRMDSLQPLAIMDLGTFTQGYRLRKFFRQSFRQLKQQNTPNLAIDLRGNGGGMITYSNLLTRYLARQPFKIADSLYAIQCSSPYARYREDRLQHKMFMILFARKKSDGRYHFPFYERKQFKPKTRNHYDGQVFLLTGGNTFSAATLVAGTLKGQTNVTLVGEETGGAAYGNNAWLIPDVTLPLTGLQFRLPLFRLVINKNMVQDGRGILPDAEALPSTWYLRNSVDFKMKRVRELIQQQGPTAGE